MGGEGMRPGGTGSRESLPLRVTLRSFVSFLVPYWTSRDSLMAWLILMVIAAMTSGAVYLATAINSWYKRFWDTVEQYDLPGFKHELMVFAILATIHVLISVYNAFLKSRLAIRWRAWLTQHVLSDWLSRDTYYKMQLTDSSTDNPDQRIAEDLNLFVSSTIALIIGTCTDVAMMITFGIVLWELSGAVSMTVMGVSFDLPDGYMFYLAIIYAVLGTAATFALGRPLVRLNFRQQRFEADFRFSLIRVREHSESIALYRGQDQEGSHLRERFSRVVANYLRLITRQKQLGFLTLGYAQLAVIFPILIAAPLYFAKIITIGSIMQISSAFGRVQDSLSTLVSNFTAWAEWKAVVDRLTLFSQAMQGTERLQPLPVSHDGEAPFVLNGLTVRDPLGRVLITDLNLSLDYGQSLLIQGPSGCGKSTLLRCICGIWPYASGEIAIRDADSMLFLSQKPYLPLGTLAQCAFYPQSSGDRAQLTALLERLGLGALSARLDDADQWSHILSLGEMQRLAIIRALLLRPRLLFLDEASSALDAHYEQVAYQLLFESLPQSIIVSVGHKVALTGLHARTLNLGEAAASAAGA